MNHTRNLIETLASPSPEYSVCYVWMWNGSATEEETRRQIDAMAAAEIRSVCILPMPNAFRPTSMITRLQPDYLSEAFFAQCAYAIDYAAERGMCVWLYDEGGWPSGGACRLVNRATGMQLGRKEIATETKTQAANVPFSAPEYPAPDAFLAAFTADGRRIAAGEVFAEDTEITVFYARQSGDDYLTDIADRRATDTFIELTHEGYYRHAGRHFGNTVPLIFNDEAAVPRFAYTPGMDAAFADTFGYDLYDYLPYIRELLPCETEAQECAHRDYRLFLGMLLRERYFLPIRDWCRAHGICSAGHLNHDHTTLNLVREASYGAPLETLRCFDIPGVDVIWRQMWPEKDAGMDPVLPFYPRYASSAAHQIGKKTVLAECLAVYGDGVTHDRIRWLCGQLAVRGVNSFNFFGLSYGKQDCDLILERPVYDPIKPGFSAMARVNRVVERLACLMQAGVPAVSCALYLPQNDILRGGSGVQAAITAFDRLGLQLEKNRIDFDIVDDAWIRGAQIRDGALCAEDVCYTAVIVPECTDIPADVREKLAAVSAEMPQPNLYCEEDAPLLARARQLADGMLTLVVNTGMTPNAGRIGVPAAGRYCFEMDLNTGEYFHCPTPETDGIRYFDAEIPGGGELVLLQTDDASLLCGAAERLCPAGASIVLTTFTAAVTEECRLTQAGVVRTQYTEPVWRDMTLGAWEDTFGADFSGTVTYRCTVTGLQTGAACMLSFGGVENTAEIRVNGSMVGIIGFSTDTVMFAVPQDTFVLEIAVSNTFANQCAAVDAHTMWDSATVGVYHDRTVRFERDCAGGGLMGPVVLTPVKRTENNPDKEGESLA